MEVAPNRGSYESLNSDSPSGHELGETAVDRRLLLSLYPVLGGYTEWDHRVIWDVCWTSMLLEVE